MAVCKKAPEMERLIQWMPTAAVLFTHCLLKHHKEWHYLPVSIMSISNIHIALPLAHANKNYHCSVPQNVLYHETQYGWWIKKYNFVREPRT